jgi:Co/Zn/Cd efflux system component
VDLLAPPHWEAFRRLRSTVDEEATEMILRTVIAIVVVLLVILAIRVFRSWRS